MTDAYYAELIRQLGSWKEMPGMSDDARRMHWLMRRATEAIAALVKDRDEAQTVRDRVILKAQCHAQEARTANDTIYQIYRACTNGTGEPGNWHGAQPVIDELAAREQRGERHGLERAAKVETAAKFLLDHIKTKHALTEDKFECPFVQALSDSLITTGEQSDDDKV